MASVAAEMIDDLRDRLNDVADTQVPFGTKMRYLNRGQAAMFPRIYRVMRDSALVLVADTFEYTLPGPVSRGKVITVEIESGASTLRYNTLTRYDLIPSVSSPTLVLIDQVLPSEAGAAIRVTVADRLAPFVAGSYVGAETDAYTGPDGTEELPVLYAMGLATAHGLDERLDYKRYSVNQQSGAASTGDLMQVSQFWFAQFEILLDRLQMPFPVSRA